MATLTITPDEPSVGKAFSVVGEDFAASTVVTLTVIPPAGGAVVTSEITSDASGQIGSSDTANQAIATLTSTGNAVAAETITVGAVTYTWRAAPTTVANEVKVGATASESLDNLKAAINLAAGSGTKYGSETVVHPTVRAGNKTATTLVLVAKTGGTGGNSLASTDTMTNMNFGGATFSGGAAATGIDTFSVIPSVPGPWTVTATDGTSTASDTVKVWTSA